MRALDLPNTNYRFNCLRPAHDKFVNETCCGLQSHWLLRTEEDFASFDAVFVGIALPSTAKWLYGSEHAHGTGHKFSWIIADSVYNVDHFAGGPLIRESIGAGLSPHDVRKVAKRFAKVQKDKTEISLVLNEFCMLRPPSPQTSVEKDISAPFILSHSYQRRLTCRR